MITIIHGDDVVSSRNFFLEEKKKSTSAPIIDADVLELPHLVQVFEGTSLLPEKKHIFVEYFFSKKLGKTFADIASYIDSVHQKGQVIFWEPKEIGKKSLTLFKNPTIRTFKRPKHCLRSLRVYAHEETITPTSIEPYRQPNQNSSST